LKSPSWALRARWGDPEDRPYADTLHVCITRSAQADLWPQA